MQSPPRESNMQPEVEHCQQEIADIEDQLRGGHSDIQGLCQALRDWHEELRLIQPGRERDRNEP